MKIGDDILIQVAAKYRITIFQLITNKSRCKSDVFIPARQEAAFRLSKELKLKTTHIAKLLGWKADLGYGERNTVLNAIESHKRNVEIAKLIIGKDN